MKLVACLPERLLALFGGKFFFSEDCTFDAPFCAVYRWPPKKLRLKSLKTLSLLHFLLKQLSFSAMTQPLPAMFSTILIDTEKISENEILLSTLFPSIIRRKHKGDDDHHQVEARLQAFQSKTDSQGKTLQSVGEHFFLLSRKRRRRKRCPLEPLRQQKTPSTQPHFEA